MRAGVCILGKNINGSPVHQPTIRIESLSPELADAAQVLAATLSLPQTGDAGYALQLGPRGLQLQELGPDAAGPVRVDFVEGALAHRRQQGGGNGQMIAKAVGVQAGIRPIILDATAGLGRDAFVLAGLGCQLWLIERQPIIAALLADGLQRGRLDLEIEPIMQRMRLQQGNAIALMRAWQDEAPQVVYLDPMFPERTKTSLVKKEMRVFRPLVGDDDDAPELLAAALELASHRVVIKRPRKAPSIPGPQPGYVIEGKSSRFDIYPKKAFKAKS
jgi:16S rRNA (guanine1516-N2)-methyltransferase